VQALTKIKQQQPANAGAVKISRKSELSIGYEVRRVNHGLIEIPM
jgi:hypothetical protein